MNIIKNSFSFSENNKIILACSGGSDSMYLVHEILKIHPKENIIIAHFNHNLRGQESDKDEKFVKEFCKKNDLLCEISNSDIKAYSSLNKIGIEEAARIKRYEFLENVRKKYSADFILTAHHLDDNIETFLFNLIRGSKLNGLSGIDEKNGFILRPFLHITKKEILKTCKTEKIEYRDDSSNLDDAFLRNYLRIHVIPKFEKVNPNYPKAFDSTMLYFKEVQLFMEESISNLIKEDSYFNINEFNSLSSLLQKELIAKVFKKTNNGTIGLTEANINEVIKFIFDKGNHTIKEIKNMKLKKINGKVFF